MLKAHVSTQLYGKYKADKNFISTVEYKKVNIAGQTKTSYEIEKYTWHMQENNIQFNLLDGKTVCENRILRGKSGNIDYLKSAINQQE